MAFPVKPEAALASCFRNILQDMHPIFNSKDLLSFWDIDQELETLETLLRSIPDVLNDAEWRSPTEGRVNVWMDNLRELLYWIEDFVDDMNIERVRIEKRLEAMNDHEAAKKYGIGDIQGYHTSQKETISESIKKIIVKLEEVEKKATKLNLKPQTLAGASFAVKDCDYLGPSVVESGIYGRQEDKDHVIELLMSPNDSSRNYSAVSIVGMGGLGKTTLARVVFMDVKSHFDMQSWACVSDDFDFSRVVRELIEFISKENTSNMITSALLDHLKGMVTAKKVLFVLDDMWTVEAWENLKGTFTHCAQGSKILVTTRDKYIGRAVNDKQIYELQKLEENYCVDLFKEKAFGGVVDERLEGIGKKIVARCKGVPLAVKVIGSSLRFAPVEMWESVLNNEIWESMGVAKDGILRVLKLSYHYLPSPLKRCFQYFAVFPTDYSFKSDDLVRLWIAEGLIESREGRMLEDIGCSYYIELQRRCIIQEDDMMHDLLHSLACLVSGKFFSHSAKGSKSYRHMRSIRHLSLIREEVNIEMFDEAICLRTLLVPGHYLFDEINLKWTLLRVLDLGHNQLRELPNTVGNLKHLRYLYLSWSRKLQRLPNSICELHNLQTLKLSGCQNISALPTHMGNLQNLRFLSLSHMKNLPALPSSIIKLSNLLMLDLRGCENLTCMPDYIGGLQSLQTLWLNGCNSISHLPSEIGNLQHLRELQLRWTSISCLPESLCNIRNLQVLDISGCDRLNSLPRNIGNLTCIQKLGRFVVGREEGHGIELLKDMNELQGELVISCLANVQSVEHALMANLNKKVLDEIHFDWGNQGHESHDTINDLEDVPDVVDRDLEAMVLDALEPYPTSLKSLSIRNYRGGRIPKWLSALSFPILKKLVMEGLDGINRTVDLEFPSLERLEIKSCLLLKDVSMGVPNLISLEVSGCRDLTTLSISPSLGNSSSSLASSILDLPQLEELTFRGCSSLRDICMVQIPGLEKLRIEDCEELKMIYVDHMPKLRELMLRSLPNLNLPRGLHAGSSSSLTSLKELSISSGRERELISLAMPFDCEAHGSDDLLLPEAGGGMFPILKDLDVQKCPNLKFIPEGLRHLTSLESITFSGEQLEARKVASLQNLPRLGTMEITGIAGQVLPLVGDDDAGSHLPPKLEKLAIKDCPNLTHLPKALLTIASLRTLEIRNCPELVSFPETGLPPLLQQLEVASCKNLQYFLPTGLNNHTSLRTLIIFDCPELVSFPETGLPPLLQVLYVSRCKNLQYFPTGLNDHTSLQWIHFSYCERVEARPDDGPPPNLDRLDVANCPKLEQQIKQHRKDWLPKTRFCNQAMYCSFTCEATLLTGSDYLRVRVKTAELVVIFPSLGNQDLAQSKNVNNS